MVMKKLKPTSPGLRTRIITVRNQLESGKPLKSLLKKVNKKSGGRNNLGRITTRHIGGGHKKKFRDVDFVRNKDNIAAHIEAIEYDPNRSARIARIVYEDGIRSYIIATLGLNVDDVVFSGNEASIKNGNCLPLRLIPIGTTIHSIEMKPGKGAQLARAAGASAQLVAKEGQYALLKLKSGYKYRLLIDCRATIGEVSNIEHNLTSHGKAGAKRWKGIRPTVRGTAMNPVDHPHGGGEGKSKGGKHPVSFSGVPTKGYKTRKNKRTNSFISKDKKRGD